MPTIATPRWTEFPHPPPVAEPMQTIIQNATRMQCMCCHVVAVGVIPAPQELSSCMYPSHAGLECNRAPWTARAYLQDLVFEGGDKPLTGIGDLTLKELMQACGPDQKGNIDRILKFWRSKGKVVDTPPQFLRALGAPSDFQAQFLAMWMCFAVDPSLMESDLDNFRLVYWRTASKWLFKSNGIKPLCTSVAKYLRKTPA